METSYKIKLTRFDCYDFWIKNSSCRIECINDIYYSYIDSRWIDNKSDSLKQAIDSCLYYLGIPKKERELFQFILNKQLVK